MILYTADWHIKLGQKNVPVKWAINRYQMFFEQVYEVEKQCSMHIIGGDIFDRLPSMEELELYFSFIRKVQIPTIIYDGNHEATKKNKTFFTQLKQVSRDINPLINIVDISYIDEDLGYGILPYADLHKKGSIDHFDTRMPLFTHIRGEIPPHVKPEIDLDLLADFPVVFADYDHTIYEIEGDIHDLAAVKNSDLLDKKVVKRNTEASLIIHKDMTIEQELVEYLTYILEISPDKIPDILVTYNDYAANVEMG